MRVIGITGNICTGKSTVMGILEKIGANVKSYDAFLYEAYNCQQCKEEIIASFVDTMLVDGKIDRISLKIHLKKHPEKCKRLWEITDKYVGPIIEQFFQENLEFSFFECANLYEKSWDKYCKQVIVCYAPDNLRVKMLVKRARERDNFYLSEEEAIAVIKQQEMPQEEKNKARELYYL